MLMAYPLPEAEVLTLKEQEKNHGQEAHPSQADVELLVFCKMFRRSA